MHIIPLFIILITIAVVFVIWSIVNKRGVIHSFDAPKHSATRTLIPIFIISVWLIVSCSKLKDGDILEVHKVYNIGEDPPIQVIVIRPQETNTFPYESKLTKESIINVNRRFGCSMPSGATVIRKYPHALESLGVIYHGTREDVLLLALPDNTRVVSNSYDIDP